MRSQHLQLGFKAYDPHELLPHFVARNLGYYRDFGLSYRLRDITHLDENDLPEDLISFACGSALMGALKESGRKIVLVSTIHPMFWLYGHGVSELFDLVGKQVAGYPVNAPPSYFLKMILRQSGIEPAEIEIEPARDDLARLGLLKAGEVAAAVISSAFPPMTLTKLGFKKLLFFGDVLRIPSAGLAVSEILIYKYPEIIRKIIDIFRISLKTIRQSPAHVNPMIAELLHPSNLEEIDCESIRNCFTDEGRIDPAVVQNFIELLSREMQLKRTPALEKIFDYSFLPPLGA
ncbi:MAG: ABC transporter substrate-binding protein [Acidobacteria bacterium]|nr:ABC transporter substrate-binding protein [Acidobacteriota bacterium]